MIVRPNYDFLHMIIRPNYDFLHMIVCPNYDFLHMIGLLHLQRKENNSTITILSPHNFKSFIWYDQYSMVCIFSFLVVHCLLPLLWFLSISSFSSISDYIPPPPPYHHSCLLFIFWDNKILCLIIIQIVHFLYRWSWLYVVRKLTRIRQVLEKVVERQRVPQVQKVPLQDISFIDQKL